VLVAEQPPQLVRHRDAAKAGPDDHSPRHLTTLAIGSPPP
jgi:hypothetical protein